ncbi:MAG: TIGR03915 family putative DNA repair protein [Atopobiaceae bacterium]|nr:TIGR03915 family putative DNA repair protein [Atopobiaceae bacterium]
MAEASSVLACGEAVVVCCERTAESVLAAIGVTYLSHADPHRARLVATDEAQARIGEKVIALGDEDDGSVVALAKRVYAGFERSCGTTCARRVVLACAADESGMPEAVHRYLRLGFTEGKRLYEDVGAPEALAFAKLVQRVSSECEHTRQFVRFARLPDGTFVSVFEPNENTLPLVCRHFARRMKEDRFVIVDPRHLVAIFHEPGDATCAVVGLDEETAAMLASRVDETDERERLVQALWQRFYRAMELPGRGVTNRGYDLRASWMPKRFWHGLPELDPRLRR